MNALITTARVIFVIVTVPLVVVALIAMFGGNADPTIAVVYILSAYAGIGVISSWKKKKP